MYINDTYNYMSAKFFDVVLLLVVFIVFSRLGKPPTFSTAKAPWPMIAMSFPLAWYTQFFYQNQGPRRDHGISQVIF